MKTNFRTPQTWRRYNEYKKSSSSDKEDPFVHWGERLVKEFTHWILIKNDFPYDRVAKKHHMLFPRRNVSFLEPLNKKEFDELYQIKEGYGKDHYDLILENLGLERTLPSRFHIHFLKLRENF